MIPITTTAMLSAPSAFTDSLDRALAQDCAILTVDAVGNTLEFVGAPHVRGRLEGNAFHLDAGPLFAAFVRQGLMLSAPAPDQSASVDYGVDVQGDEVLLIAHGWRQSAYEIEDIGRCVEVWMPGTDWPSIVMGLLARAQTASPDPA